MPAMTTLVDGTVPVAADFNGNFTALNAAIGSSTSISAWSIGEIPYASATDTLSRLTPGSEGKILTMASGIPSWAAPTGASDQLSGLALSNSGGDPTNDIDVAVGLAASDDATYANRQFMSLTSAITKQLDANWAVGTAAGGLDTGSIANDTYHVFLIKRTDTGVVDVLFSISPTAPTMPASYTLKRRIGSIVRTGAAIKPFTQHADVFMWTDPVLDTDATNPGSSAVTRTATIPTDIALEAISNVFLSGTGASRDGVYISPLTSTDSAASLTAAPLSSNSNGASSTFDADTVSSVVMKVFTNTSAQYRSRMIVGTASILRIATLGWVDVRGKG